MPFVASKFVENNILKADILKADTKPPCWGNLREIAAGQILREYLMKKSDHDGAKSVKRWYAVCGSYTGKVCIIGAGAAGLYIAMMLQFLDIDFDIVEANDRVGGRCATHSFAGVGADCAHNYYDMGAMRILDIKPMAATLNLIRNPSLLNIPGRLVDYFGDGYDRYSTRDYLMLGKNLTYLDTMAGELSDLCSGLILHRALCTPVVEMSLTPDGTAIQVATGGQTPSTKSYDMVFNTTALGPLQKMDLSGMNLDRVILDGIRALSYDRATKVAIKFNTRWWKNFYPDAASVHRGGGISKSDLPLGFTVYPSWDDGDGTNVLIVSHTWAQDATRMAALVPDYANPSTPTPSYTNPIAAVCLEGLVKLW
ncbi:hypothetical protein QBC36DRAFT_369767 [Triangularia setosa]|uniref:Amine oxidase domain-containing protein n=1 Tax=Triangularia setosa TaxID=2587417 RepID=A0AAN7A2C8_9PEZI|nr:hypothetical protein QBC36DRAFT_369767 [Podospora setosa]